MTVPNSTLPQCEYWLDRARFDALISMLRDDGFRVIGPTVDQGAIIYAEIESSAELPQGWTDRQAPGEYRLERRRDEAWFGYVVGPHSWKRYFFPPTATVATAQQTPAGWQFGEPAGDEEKFALLGVRACELAAMQIQDRVFIEGEYVDPIYASRRQGPDHCRGVPPPPLRASASMDTGPHCRQGFDLSLTELAAGFVVEAGSTREPTTSRRGACCGRSVAIRSC